MADFDCERWVAGVDGCRGGWLVVSRPLDDPSRARVSLLKRFADVLAMSPRAALIAVDMPIGLAARAGIGGRRADVEARANLGKRKSAVFAMPSREAVEETDYVRACEAAARTSEPSRMISKQAFNIFPKIREIDVLMTPEFQDRVREVHPELGFWALNGEKPLDLPKKMKASPDQPGLAFRRRLLSAAGYDAALLEGRGGVRAADAGRDDLLDAAVCSWSAARILRGEGRRFPSEPEIDAKGLRMEIWC
jgi:predicted RNase H-like nuclease